MKYNCAEPLLLAVLKLDKDPIEFVFEIDIQLRRASTACGIETGGMLFNRDTLRVKKHCAEPLLLAVLKLSNMY